MEKSSLEENSSEEQPQPHPQLPNTSTITTVTFDAELIDEFKCPICLDIMQSVMVTWCLHRFCKSCIEKHLRLLGNTRDCPSCRVKIKSKRDLRSDSRMDALIYTVFGRIERTEDETCSPPHKRFRENSDEESGEEAPPRRP